MLSSMIEVLCRPILELVLAVVRYFTVTPCYSLLYGLAPALYSALPSFLHLSFDGTVYFFIFRRCFGFPSKYLGEQSTPRRLEEKQAYEHQRLDWLSCAEHAITLNRLKWRALSAAMSIHVLPLNDRYQPRDE